MKKSDWALIILIVVVVGVISWFVIGSILPKIEDESVTTAPAITANLDAPANNVMLYSADRPSWCASDAADDAQDATTEEQPSEEETTDQTTTGNETKQPINSAFNACAINSSFTTTTE